MSILSIDVGTSSVRATIVRPDSSLAAIERIETPPDRSRPGVVEFDAELLAESVIAVATRSLEKGGPVDAVAIATQRASAVVWDRATGRPVAPAIGWQDVRSAGRCLALQAEGLRLAPNQSATKLEVLLARATEAGVAEPRFGTVDSWIAWRLSEGALHLTDSTNAAVTGLLDADAVSWDHRVLELLNIPIAVLPQIVASSSVFGRASALPGSPMIAALIGDQQASLVGQGCLEVGMAKATFGTGGMLDCCVGLQRPTFTPKGPAGTFPVVGWREPARLVWGVEAIMLAAGSCISWLCDGLQILDSPVASDELAASVPDAGGVSFVPALEGIATPLWDLGARGTLVGLTGATTRAEIVRAVLEGIAHSGADLLESIESDTGLSVSELRVDGGMSVNRTFVQLLANAIGRPVRPSPVAEATTLGASYLAGVAVGTWGSLEEAAGTVSHEAGVEPTRILDRARWRTVRERSLRTVPALSALQF